MMPIVAMRLSAYLRTYLVIAPTLATLVAVGLIYGGGVARPEEAYGLSAIVLFPVLAWQVKILLDAEPVDAVGISQSAFMAKQGLEDGVMSVVRFDNGVLAQLHDAFTIKHAGHGIEIHGDAGSIVGRNVMSQRPVGEVVLRNDAGEHIVPVEHEGLYVRGVASFCAALQGTGRPAATGEDGVRSLAAAVAVADACRVGSLVRVPEINI